MASVTPPRGMRDFLPADVRRRQRLMRIIRDRYSAHGFEEIETPVLEDYARLHSGIGGDNEKLAFTVLRRGMDAEAIRAAADDPAALSDLGLRYDLTVPLARFYATHRGSLPTVFRSIQIAPAWRAERPQKGRYRQFMQCDIDIIGDPTERAEVELLVASLDTLDALGLEGATIRVNDRRLLDGMLAAFGIDEADRPQALITIDKLDKIGADGVARELRERDFADASVAALESYLAAVTPAAEFTAEAIAQALPDGVDPEVVAGLQRIGDAVAAGRNVAAPPLEFDPFLVRGMGYYTGPIFEVVHPDFSSSLGGGGRYDGLVGRFLGDEVPAAGFSLGYERVVELLGGSEDDAGDSIVLVHGRDVPLAELAALKAHFIESGARVRLERRPKNLRGLLDRSAADGFASFALVTAGAAAPDLEIRPLG